MDHYNHSLAIGATITVSKTGSIIGEHVIIFMRQKITIATVLPAKKGKSLFYFRILINRIRCNL